MLPGPGPRRSFPPFGKANALDKESRLSGFRSFSNHPACYSDAVAVRHLRSWLPETLVPNYTQAPTAQVSGMRAQISC